MYKDKRYNHSLSHIHFVNRIPGYLKVAIAAIFLIICAAGCSKPRFTLQFVLPESLHAAYNMSYYASSPKGGRWMETAVMLQKGKGKLMLPLVDPTVVSVAVGGTTVFIYAERGNKIMVSGKDADPFNWTITGNSINEDWSNWRRQNVKELSSNKPEAVNMAVEKYVVKHPENPLSALLLLYEYDRREDNEGFLKLWKMLKGEAAKEKWISISGRTDLYTNKPLQTPVKGKRHKIILKSLGNGTDTVITGKDPVVLLVWRNQDKNRDELIDSLRNLRKQHPDSASFIIADICFDTDSLSWASPLGRDSLKHVIRAWNPIGEADSTMRALGIERTPMILTIK